MQKITIMHRFEVPAEMPGDLALTYPDAAPFWKNLFVLGVSPVPMMPHAAELDLWVSAKGFKMHMLDFRSRPGGGGGRFIAILQCTATVPDDFLPD